MSKAHEYSWAFTPYSCCTNEIVEVSEDKIKANAFYVNDSNYAAGWNSEMIFPAIFS